MTEDLAGDVKQLTNSTPEYRLRVGDYRVLFEIEGNIIGDAAEKMCFIFPIRYQGCKLFGGRISNSIRCREVETYE
jgi:hypothetical protein